MSRRWSLLVLCGCVWLIVSIGHVEAARGRALLVGVTKYPSLKAKFQLRGPVNDVRLMRDVLKRRFAFVEDNVVLLTETVESISQVNGGGSSPEDRLPTRANIVREIGRLIEQSETGDTVVILLAGHGSQQRNDNPNEDDEPDGLDETFLPRDIGVWDRKKAAVSQAIIDDELGLWTEQLKSKGVHVLLIADCCHSGTLLRGTEISRMVPEEELVVELQTNESRTEFQTAPSGNRNETIVGVSNEIGREEFGSVTAIYAAHSNETEPEDQLPHGSQEARHYGYLTFHLCQALEQTTNCPTYRELLHRIHRIYQGAGYYQPTPWIQSDDLDRETLGTMTWKGTGRIGFVSRSVPWIIDAGTLHGLAKGDTLSVIPEGSQTPVGHVRVDEVSLSSANVRGVAFASLPELNAIPDQARCLVVEKNIGDGRLAIGISRVDSNDRKIIPSRYTQIREAIQSAVRLPNSMAKFVESPSEADWLIEDTGEAQFVSFRNRAGFDLLERSRHLPAVTVGDESLRMKITADFPKHLATVVQRIGRYQNLVKIAELDQAQFLNQNMPRIKIELLRKAVGTETFEATSPESNLELNVGECVRWRVQNDDEALIAITLLYLDDQYQITPWFPRDVYHDNLLAPKQSIETLVAEVQAGRGYEHMVLISEIIQEQTQPPSYLWLAQPSLKAAITTRGNARSPFVQLLDQQCFGVGSVDQLTRSYQKEKFEPRIVRMSWLTKSWK